MSVPVQFIPDERLTGASTKAPPAVLSIAGFDPSSGAGFTADLKVFAAHGLFGLACPTALTVQSTQGVRRVEPVTAELVRDTLDTLSADVAIAGVKIGMLASEPVVREVVRWLTLQAPNMPVVLDPVLRSSSGALLLDEDAERVLVNELLPLVSLLTPNAPECAALSGFAVPDRSAVPGAARALLARCRPDAAVVVTGGHFDKEETASDFLLAASGREGEWFESEWVRTRATHGTGCAFSSSLLCGLVRGASLRDSVSSAKNYVRGAMMAAYPMGRGRGPIHHLFTRDQDR